MPASDENLLPKQQQGGKSDSFENRYFATNEQAAEAFHLAKQRLYDINNWGSIIEGISAAFTLMDKEGARLDRAPAEGDFIRIDLPGPGSIAGHGYDWVQIESILESHPADLEETIALRVRPAEDPIAPEGPAHFFDSAATGTFLIRKKGRVVSAGVHGRNETPAEADKLVDTVRNKVVSGVAVLGASQFQWGKLCKALIGK